MFSADEWDGLISYRVTPRTDGVGYTCALTASRDSPPQRFSGQTAKHALAVAIEHLASTLRREAEDEQGIRWDRLFMSESSSKESSTYHISVHYERIAEEASKFDAAHNTLMGNMIAENAAIDVIQIDPKLTIDIVDGKSAV